VPKRHPRLTGGKTWTVSRLEPKCSAGATDFDCMTEQIHAELLAEHENIAAT